MSSERIQKILAAAGHGSRRECEKYIVAGRVRVNGRVATLGEKADPAKDRITLDGKPVVPEKVRYILVNKPRWIVSSLNAQGERRTVRDLVPFQERLYPVGRLDLESEGLILLTNDGELTNRLTHPRYALEKEYNVLVSEFPREEQLEIWRRGIVLDGKKTAKAKVRILSKGTSGTWLRVVMHEGRKHQIRLTAQALGLQVKRLRRVRMGPLRLGNLRPGKWRELKPHEIKALRAQTGQSKRPRRTRSRR